MLVFCFFASVFSSVSWLIYSVMFVGSNLVDARLSEQSAEQMLLLLAVVFLPILVIWMVFGFINQFANNRSMNVKQNELLRQLQKNQDYTDLVVRVMLDAEHEIKDGFVINKFDLFVSDMNEALSEIIQRCNIASNAQLEQLWQRVKRGERWTLGKAILDASKSQSTFDAWVREKVGRDKVFRGTLLEFCSRYQNLLQLLEKHDRDRIFLRIIETGVFGKVYSIIAPLADGLSESPVLKVEQPKEQKRDYSSVLKIATMEEPEATQTIVNVDKNDEVAEEEFEAPKRSLFSRIFKREEVLEDDEHEQDPFFKALHNSFQDSDEVDEAETVNMSAPQFESVAPVTNDNQEKSAPTFGSLRNTLDNLRSESEPVLGVANEPVMSAKTENEKKSEEDKEDLAYPFGGWTDEENYR